MQWARRSTERCCRRALGPNVGIRVRWMADGGWIGAVTCVGPTDLQLSRVARDGRIAQLAEQ